MSTLKSNLPYVEVEPGQVADKIEATMNKSIFPNIFVKFGKTQCFLPRSYAKLIEKVENFEIRDDDVWIVTYPKSGTTWMQELTWLVTNDLNFEGAKSQISSRAPFFDNDAWMCEVPISASGYDWWRKGPDVPDGQERTIKPSSMDCVAQLASPRVIKSHLPYNMLPQGLKGQGKKPKIVYVARNPKDVCISFYHFHILFHGYLGTLDQFVEEFASGYAICGPQLAHVKEYWDLKDQSNILFLTYEEMIKDLSGVVNKTAKFLGKVIPEDKMEQLIHHLSFETMKNNPFVNKDELTDALIKIHGIERKTHFFRRGKVGSWKEELSPRHIEMLDKYITDNYIPGLY